MSQDKPTTTEQKWLNRFCSYEYNFMHSLSPYIVDIDDEEIEKIANDTIPNKLKRIRKLEKTTVGNTLSDSFLLDALGVDFFISVEGQRYAIDVTKANRKLVQAKREKMIAEAAFFRGLKAVPTVVRIGTFAPPDNLVDYLRQASFRDGILDVRINKDFFLINQAFYPLQRDVLPEQSKIENFGRLFREMAPKGFKSLFPNVSKGMSLTREDLARLKQTALPDLILELDGTRILLDLHPSDEHRTDNLNERIERLTEMSTRMGYKYVILVSKTGLIPDNIRDILWYHVKEKASSNPVVININPLPESI